MFTEDISDTIWKNFFCMNKITFFELAEILRPMISSDTNSSRGKFFREGSLPGALHEVLPGYGVVPNYLIAEPAYPFDPFVLERVPPLFKQPAGEF